VDTDLRRIPVGLCHPNPDQPRKHFDEDELRALALDIDGDPDAEEVHGQVVPAIVRHSRTMAGGFEIMAGERRWRAISSHCVRVHELLAVVRDVPDDKEAFRISFVENENRQDLHPLEKAEAMRRLVELGHTQSAIGRMIGKSISYVQLHLRLTTLHPEVKKLMDPRRPEKDRLKYTAATDIAAMPHDLQPGVAIFAIGRGNRLAHTREKIAATLSAAGAAESERKLTGHHRTAKRDIAALRSTLRRRFPDFEAVDRVYRIRGSGHLNKDTIRAIIEGARELSIALEDFAEDVERVYDARFPAR
jgi:ParB/RepB/Spo0J family partition protein